LPDDPRSAQEYSMIATRQDAAGSKTSRHVDMDDAAAAACPPMVEE
jgi:hypothetical protein